MEPNVCLNGLDGGGDFDLDGDTFWAFSSFGFDPPKKENAGFGVASGPDKKYLEPLLVDTTLSPLGFFTGEVVMISPGLKFGEPVTLPVSDPSWFCFH